MREDNLLPMKMLRGPIGGLCGILILAEMSVAAEPVQFNRDIRPILSATCFSCHGPDEHGRKAKLRLDTAEAITEDADGWRPIVPGDPRASEAWARIISDDPDELMPPPESHLEITGEQKALIKRWIEEGAAYEKHWAYTPPKKTPVAQDQMSDAIDYFIERRLKKEGLALSSPAGRGALLRRLYLDLTGVPPTADELEAFLADDRPNAYELAVDQVLAYPRSAERLALEWLDVARYADTNGYSIDDHRDMWVWRDWVIHAFLKNKAYDEFVVEQLAGDLMPDATDLQKVATGFLRNSMNTHEGGTIAEEYRVAYIADKIDTVSTAFMGLTMKCAQCHDHKYDPVSMKDYYRFFAFFNASSEPGRGATNANTQPLMPATSPLQNDASFQRSIDLRMASLRHRMHYPGGDVGKKRAAWEARQAVVLKDVEIPHQSDAPLVFPVPASLNGKNRPDWIWANAGGTSEWAYVRTAIALNTQPEKALMFLSCDNEADVWINGKPAGRNPDWREPSVIDIRPYLHVGTNLVAIRGKDWQGGSMASMSVLIALSEADGKVRYIPSNAQWEASETEIENWEKPGAVAGFANAHIVRKYGKPPYGTVLDQVKKPKVGNVLLAQALRTETRQRTDEQWQILTDAFAKTEPDFLKVVKSIRTEIKILERARKQGHSTVMVMNEGAKNRKTFVLMRGAYDAPGEEVSAGVPSLFEGLPPETEANRLALARWLVGPDNPLTARVTVNRYWQMLFGTGLVKTTEDFGSQGEWPSHIELLDWLAVDFVEKGWNVRHLLKQMVLSKTYRQQAAVSDHLLEVDPYNRLLARAPRSRLPAELLRDTVLSISGLLNPSVGGPSVHPYQPSGLWKEVSHFGHPTVFTAQHFYPDLEHGLYRRSMYTFWKRTSPPPTMAAFDAPNRETCTVRRLRTNTPLQALILMNDPQYVEAARFFAQNLMKHSGDVQARIEQGFYQATSRKPTEREVAVLMRNYQRQKAYFAANPERAAAYLEVGVLPVTGHVAPVELAALSSVAALILNLDETITRE